MFKRVFLLLLFFLAPACLAMAEDDNRRQTSSETEKQQAGFSKIPQRMRAFVAEHQIAGAVTLVANRERVLHCEAVGEAVIEKHAPMRKDTVFAIASMTKPITATALMILVDEGKLAIADPVSKYLPEFAGVALKEGPPKRAITIRDLLTHTSGLVGEQRTQGTLEQTATMLSKRPLGFQPGTKWSYSPGLNVCARIIEIVSGQPYDDFLAQRIFQPLGMVDTTFAPSASQRKRMAKLYQPSDDKNSLVPGTHWLLDFPQDSQNRTPNPSGGLFSTAGDMARFYQMVLGGGEREGRRFLSAAAVRKMTTLQTGDLKTGFTPGCGWGLGWCLVREPQGVTAMLSPGTFGHGGAFGTQGWVDPQRGLIFVLMIQRTGFGNGDAAEIRREFQELAVQALVK